MDNKALKNKVIITAAVTGAWPKKENNPNVPMTPQEIADDVYACWKAGAAVAHLHMRDDEGNGTMDTAKFEETVNLIHTKYPDCDIVLNLTTSGDIHADDEIRVAHVKKLKPEMASYDCGSMNWLNSGLFLNTPKFLTDCGLLFQELGVKPEIEAFDPGMIGNAAYYIKKGVLKTPVHFQFCMGCANGIAGSMNWLNSGLFLNTPKFLTDCGLLFQELGVKPEIEAFDPGMIGNAAYYIKKGVLKTPVHFQFCMGCANGIAGSMKNLIFMKETADELVGKGNYTWSCFGVGHSAMEMLYGAVALGGNIRVGMEDNVMYAKGQLAESNVQFIERAVRVIKEYGKEVATPDEARQILNLAK